MLEKLKATFNIKSATFWAGFATGAVAAVAFPKLANLVRPVAKKVPGSSAA
jgi:hypothetical protein